MTYNEAREWIKTNGALIGQRLLDGDQAAADLLSLSMLDFPESLADQLVTAVETVQRNLEAGHAQ